MSNSYDELIERLEKLDGQIHLANGILGQAAQALRELQKKAGDFQFLYEETNALVEQQNARIEELERNLRLCNESCGEWADDNERLEAALTEISAYSGDEFAKRVAREALTEDGGQCCDYHRDGGDTAAECWKYSDAEGSDDT